MISLCMIVKNESHNLLRLLESVKNHVDEIIIVDTGSTDNSIEIALQFGANISQVGWNDDFSAARNHALIQAKGDWIIVLDADEQLVVSGESLQALVKKQPEAINVLTVGIFNFINDYTVVPYGSYPRIFRNHLGIHYEGRLHEQLTYGSQKISRSEIGLLPDSIRINHYGYQNNNLDRKNRQRYIPLMEKFLEEGDISLMLLHCLFDTYQSVGNSEGAERCIDIAMDRISLSLVTGILPNDQRWLPTWLYLLGCTCIEREDLETLWLIFQRGIEWFPKYPPFYNLIGSFLARMNLCLGAIPYFEKCLQLCMEGRENLIDIGIEIYEPLKVDELELQVMWNLAMAYITVSEKELAIQTLKQIIQLSPTHELAHDQLNRLIENT